ncbi:MAG: ROK family protein [Brotaphodocola sp.]
MEKMIGKNSISSKQYNRGLILKLIATGVCRTRIELSRTTQLAKMTVTNIVSELIGRNIVVECEEERTEVCGRNPILLRISEKAPKIIGLLIFRDRIAAVLCSLTMEILDMEEIRFQNLTQHQMAEYSYTVIDRLMERENNILGIGTAVIGPVDSRSGILLNPIRFYGIHDVDILGMLKQRYSSYPIYLDHDNSSAALAEKLYGIGRDSQDFIFLGISNGIGSGIISGGKVFHNRQGLEPEIGHISIDYNGPVCSCGNRGCLEMYASTYVILEKLRKATGLEREFPFFFRMKEDAAVGEIFEDMVRKISAALVSSVNILHPELIVLGHDCMDWDDTYVAMLEDIVNERMMLHTRNRLPVRKAYFGKNAQLVGAAANVVVQLFKGELL